MVNQTNKSKAFIQELEVLTNARLQSQTLKIFVLGPHLASTCPGGNLRRSIISFCNQDDLAVIAEHKDVIGIAKKHHKSAADMTLAETAVALIVDVIIIVPDSAGSLAELGFFATLGKDIWSKITIFFNKEYNDKEHKKSYIYLGPRAMAKRNGATIKFLEYNSPDKILSIVRTKIEEARTRKVFENMIR